MLKGRIPPEQVKFHPEKFPKYKQDYLATPLLDYPAYQDGQASAGAAMHTNEMR